MYKHILVPTDGSKLSARAVKQAEQFAKSVGAKLTALHVSQEYRALMDEGFALPAFNTLKKRFDEQNAKRSSALLDDVKKARVDIEPLSGERLQEVVADTFDIPQDVLARAQALSRQVTSGTKP